MANAPFTKSGDTIVQDFAASAQSSSKTTLNFSLGSVFLALAEACASVADWLQKLYLFALLISRLQTSRGLWVDTFCADFMSAVDGSVTTDLPNGSPRLQASPATGTVTFSRSSPQAQVIIPIGTQVATFDGNQLFKVIVNATNIAYSATIIPGGGYIVAANVPSIDLPVQALTVGTGGNVAAGSITLIRSTLVGIDTVTNTGATTSGLDAENDDALKARFKLFILSLRAGTDDAIAFAITSLQQGLQYVIHNNVLPDGSTSYGSVTVYVDDGSGVIASTLVDAANNAVNGVRAAGARPNVLAATKVSANITLTITTATGYDHNTLVADVSNAIGAYVQSLQIEQTLRYTMIEHIAYNVSVGITNVSNLSLNSGTSDVVPSQGQTVKLGNSGVVVS